MITCLIIEDEPLAADILQDYVRQVPFLHLEGICSDALFALEALQQKPIDLLFLDIHLPGLKGLDFLKTLPHPPAVIITTAYHEYAVQGYEHNITDYLLKPIEFTRFLSAVNKVKELPRRPATLTIQADKKKVVIPIDDIIYVESQKEYIVINTHDASYTTRYALTKLESELDPARFLRIHRSFIIALSKVKAFQAAEVELPGKVLPVGRNYREPVLARLESYFN